MLLETFQFCAFLPRFSQMRKMEKFSTLLVSLMKIQQQFSQWTWNYDHKTGYNIFIKALHPLELNSPTTFHSQDFKFGCFFFEFSTPYELQKFSPRAMKFFSCCNNSSRAMSQQQQTFEISNGSTNSLLQHFIYFYYLFPLLQLQFQFQLDLCRTGEKWAKSNSTFSLFRVIKRHHFIVHRSLTRASIWRVKIITKLENVEFFSPTEPTNELL